MLNEPSADLSASVPAADADAFHLCSEHAGARQTRNERELEHADDLGTECRDQNGIAGLCLYGLERRCILGQELPTVSRLSQDVIAKHVGQCGEVGLSRRPEGQIGIKDRKSTRLNSSHVKISYAVFCLKK